MRCEFSLIMEYVNRKITVVHNCHGKSLFFGKFGALCIPVTSVLRFALLPYYRRNNKFCSHIKKVYFQLKKICLQRKRICSHRKKVWLHTQNKPTVNSYGKQLRQIPAGNSHGKFPRQKAAANSCCKFLRQIATANSHGKKPRQIHTANCYGNFSNNAEDDVK